MVVYSQGYKERNRQTIRALEEAVSPAARAVNRALTPHFEKSATQKKTDPGPGETESK